MSSALIGVFIALFAGFGGEPDCVNEYECADNELGGIAIEDSWEGYDDEATDDEYYDDFWGSFYGDDYGTGLPDNVDEIDERAYEYAQTLPQTPQLFVDEYATGIPASFTYSQDPIGVDLSAQEVYDAMVDSVVYINTFLEGDFFGIGTGVLISADGVVLTNYHVIEASDQLVAATADGEIYAITEVLAADKARDLAVIKMPATGLKPAPLAEVGSVRVGDAAIVIGHPENLIFSLSDGLISGIRPYFNTGEGLQYQITSPISGGSSGSPVFNDRGQVVGLVSSSWEYESNITQVQNLNFVVSIETILDVLEG